MQNENKEGYVDDKSHKKIERNIDENLKVLRTIYAVLFAVGYREILLNFGEPRSLSLVINPAFVLSAGALLLLGVRMFWGVRNIRGSVTLSVSAYYTRNMSCPKMLRYDYASDHALSRWRAFSVMAIEVPVLMAHSFCFYFLCVLQKQMLEKQLRGATQDLTLLREFAIVFVALMWLNALWLFTREAVRSGAHRSSIWAINNAVSGLLAAIAYWARDMCNPPSFFGGQPIVFWLIFGIVLANCLVDLIFTAHIYLIQDPG